jgi:hypothetical protein
VNSGAFAFARILNSGSTPLSPHESTAIADLTDEIRNLRRDVAVLHTKLLGDEKTENEQGRIPVLEKQCKDHDKRITRQERREWMVRGMAVLVGAVVTAAGFLYELTNINRGH